jgi:hypothetical protein
MILVMDVTLEVPTSMWVEEVFPVPIDSETCDTKILELTISPHRRRTLCG